MKPSIVFRHFQPHHWIISVLCLIVVVASGLFTAFVAFNYELGGFDDPDITSNWGISLVYDCVHNLGLTDTAAQNSILAMVILVVILIFRIITLWRDKIYREVCFDISSEHIPSNGSSLDLYEDRLY